jgi:hypothetical protein
MQFLYSIQSFKFKIEEKEKDIFILCPESPFLFSFRKLKTIFLSFYLHCAVGTWNGFCRIEAKP